MQLCSSNTNTRVFSDSRNPGAGRYSHNKELTNINSYNVTTYRNRNRYVVVNNESISNR